MAKKSRVAKTRNHGTMSEAAFFGFIRSALRGKSRWWKPINACKQAARRPVKDKGRQKWEYQCNNCKGWFSEKETQVDHIVEVGALKSLSDLPVFVERLFCEVDGLQVLCIECHNKKTKEYMLNRR
jgi:5-methylcytosine-specific restriction endonuclease McrA